MGWRFRKSLGNKFLRLNISKTGFSVTGGVPGAHVNMDLSNRRKRMFRNTYGIPGSGLYYVTDDYGPRRVKNQPGRELPLGGLAFVVGLITLLIVFAEKGFW